MATVEINSRLIGWECPKCGRVYSQTQSMCLYCGNDTLKSPQCMDDWYRTYASSTQADNILNNSNKYVIGGSDYRDSTTSDWKNYPNTQTNTTIGRDYTIKNKKENK